MKKTNTENVYFSFEKSAHFFTAIFIECFEFGISHSQLEKRETKTSVIHIKKSADKPSERYIWN